MSITTQIKKKESKQTKGIKKIPQREHFCLVSCLDGPHCCGKYNSEHAESGLVVM